MPSRLEIIQATRFEYGIRPSEPRFSGDLLAQLDGDDPMDRSFPVQRTLERLEKLRVFREIERMETVESDAFRQARRQFRRLAGRDVLRLLGRAVQNPRGFRERLFAFWLDHFSVSPTRANEGYLLAAYFEDAIRPNISGRFADMLKAVVTHPSMLFYLDQHGSAGPNSRVGLRRGKGLNENLAREVLELHTLGVGGPYTQADVTQFAELLTGLRIGFDGTHFVPNRAEPGAERVMGVSYGQTPARLEDIQSFLEDLAMMPATAMYLAQKLVVHFIGPVPAPDLVAQMAEAYLATGGELRVFYEVLLEDPSASLAVFPKVRPPFEYVATALRALDMEAEAILNASDAEARKLFSAFEAMGQKPFRPGGPDGWPEDAESWITAPQLAARIAWAGEAARHVADERDPRALMHAVLGDTAPDFLSFAISGAESKWEGLALLLVSPSLMRR